MCMIYADIRYISLTTTAGILRLPIHHMSRSDLYVALIVGDYLSEKKTFVTLMLLQNVTFTTPLTLMTI